MALSDYDKQFLSKKQQQQLLALTNRETELVNQYYSQSARLNSLLGSFFPPYGAMAQTLVDLIQVRNQLAAYLGYDSYDAYANDYLYDRDYTPQQMAQYLDDIRQMLDAFDKEESK